MTPADVSAPARAPEAGVQATRARLLRRLQALEVALMEGPHKAAADSPMASALAAVEHSTQRVLQLHLGAGSGPAGPAKPGDGTPSPSLQAQQHAALQQAHQAQLALFNQVQVQHKRLLAQRQGQLQQQHTVLLAAMAFLSAVALALAAGLVRRLRSEPLPQEPQPLGPGPESRAAPWPAAAAATTAPTLQKLETGRLLSRLRTARDRPGTEVLGAPQDPQHRPQPQDTVPPGKP